MDSQAAVTRKKKSWRRLVPMAGLLVMSLVAARLYLSVWLLQYVNNVLDNIDGYRGSVEAIDIDLYRGAYRIHNLKVTKSEGNIPVPFVDIEIADLSVQWGALLHGRIVSDVDLVEPALNFAVNKQGTTQAGEGAHWTTVIKDLMPIDINRVSFREGKLSYQDFSTNPKVNVYIQDMRGEVHNLRNVDDENELLPSTLEVHGKSIGNGNLAITGKLNILKPVPDMDLDMRLEQVQLSALNNYTKAYAAIDIEKGELDLYSEFILKDSQVSGYVKPIATNIAILDVQNEGGPLQTLWEGVVAAIVEIFTNQPKDQFATRVPFNGNFKNVETSAWSAVTGIIRNAFIEAFSKGLDRNIEIDNEAGQS